MLGTVSAGIVDSVSPSLSATLALPVVLVAISAYAVFFKVPESNSRSRGRIDAIGFIGLAVAMVLLLSGLRLASSEGFGSLSTIASLAAALLVFTTWVLWELRVSSPAVDVRLIVSRRLGPIYLTGFLFGMVVFGGQAPLSTFLAADPAATGYGFEATPSTVSGVLALITLLATVGGASFAYLAKLIGIRTVLILGAVLAAAANLAQTVFHAELWHLWLTSGVSGIGMGLLLGALPALLAERAPQDQTGIATGVYNSLRTLGGAAAGAIFGLILSVFAAADGRFAAIEGYITIWTISGLAFIGAVVCLLMLESDRPSNEPSPPEFHPEKAGSSGFNNDKDAL
ncbi:MFS transporter [Zhihengliuella halotolerans]|uniref:MFS transporter n=1 Tax=Zhihengliuella halotolerans TaxID=370736 RepID=UPI0030FEF592